MSTTLIPMDPAMPLLQSTRLLTISASLLPDEIVMARRARQSRGWVIVAVAVVAVLCAAWFARAHQQKDRAEDQLATATNTVLGLQRDQRGFAGTLQVQANTARLNEQLAAVMAKDLDWATMLKTLRSAGTPSGVTIDGVNGLLYNTDTASSTTNVLPGASTATSIGSLVVTGAAPDKEAVAAYVDTLGMQSVLTNPYVTSVASAEPDGVTFSLKVDITSAALCGRFTTSCKSTGGK